MAEMRSRSLLFISHFVGWVFVVGWVESLFSAPAPSAVAFVDVTVVPMDSERIIEGQTVVVEGDRITKLGPTRDVPLPDGALRINGRGKFLMPGIGEMHGHNPPLGSSPEYVASVYFLFLSNGVTTVRSMMCFPGQIELRDQVNSGKIFGPTLYMAGPSFGGSTRSPAEAEARVKQQKTEGWDLLKVQGSIKRDPYDAMARTADAIGIRFGGHIPADVGLVHALSRRQNTIEHLDGYIHFLQADGVPIVPNKLEEAVKLTRAAGTAVAPTLFIWEILTGKVSRPDAMRFPELAYVPRTEIQRWTTSPQKKTAGKNSSREEIAQLAANRRILLKALHDAGVPVLFATDAPQEFSVPGFSIHREMRVMAELGMSPYGILKSATKNVGEYFKAQDRFGTVAIGQRADLILLEANPLTDVAHVAKRAGVMVRGRWLPESEIQRKLAQLAESWRH